MKMLLCHDEISSATNKWWTTDHSLISINCGLTDGIKADTNGLIDQQGNGTYRAEERTKSVEQINVLGDTDWPSNVLEVTDQLTDWVCETS